MREWTGLRYVLRLVLGTSQDSTSKLTNVHGVQQTVQSENS